MLDTQEYPRLEERLLLRTFFGGAESTVPGFERSRRAGRKSAWYSPDRQSRHDLEGASKEPRGASPGRRYQPRNPRGSRGWSVAKQAISPPRRRPTGRLYSGGVAMWNRHDERPRPWYAPLARHEGTLRPVARQSRNAGCPASARGTPLLARIPLRPAGAGHARLPALPAARVGDPAAPAARLGGGLSEDLDARGLAAPRPQPGAGGEGPGAAGRCRPGGARDALRPARDRASARPLRRGRSEPPGDLAALSSVQLLRHRLRDRARPAARGRALEYAVPSGHPAV